MLAPCGGGMYWTAPGLLQSAAALQLPEPACGTVHQLPHAAKSWPRRAAVCHLPLSSPAAHPLLPTPCCAQLSTSCCLLWLLCLPCCAADHASRH